MTAIEFLRRYRPGSLVKSSARGEYQLAEHDSFKINGESSVWHWKSRDIGGKSALKYLIYVEGVPFVEAVQLLCDESPMYIPVQHEAVERERPPFRLPNPAPNNDRVTRYLLGRGISLPTIRYCIARKILYESAEYHNCVFLGKDPQGVPKYAALRGIYDYGKPFKREAPGSQKQYGFCIPPMQPGTTVAVFEAAIDAMAEMTLCGDKTNPDSPRIQQVNTALKQLRQEERLCRKIAEHSLEVQQHLTEARRDRAEQQQREQEHERARRPNIDLTL